jgi:hypothetical protein
VIEHSGSSQRRCDGWPVRGLLALLATIGVALSVAILPTAALAASPPEVQIEPAEQTPTGFRLKAKVNPEGSATTYYFIYKDTGVECEDLEGCGPETPRGGPLTGDTLQEVQAEVTGLTPGRQYRYWLIAWNGSPEAVRSPELTFTTPPATTPSEVVTGPAEVIPGGAKLKGELNPGGLPTTYWFEYIADHAVECVEVENCWPQTAHTGPITGDAQQQVPPIEVTGLTSGETYRYRLTASNADGTVSGNVATFTVGSSPVIDSVSLSNLASSDATLEAQIDTEGLGTTYAFHMWSSCAHEECEYLANIPLPSGSLLGSFVPQSVSLDLASAGVTLRYGEEYGWGITATNAAGHTSMSGGVFEPPPPSVVEPLSTTTSPLSGAGQPAGSNTSSGDQPAGSGASSSSSTPGVQSPDVLGTKTTKLEPFEDAQKLSKALKLCDKKPKSKRQSCKRQAEKKYATTSKHHP